MTYRIIPKSDAYPGLTARTGPNGREIVCMDDSPQAKAAVDARYDQITNARHPSNGDRT